MLDLKRFAISNFEEMFCILQNVSLCFGALSVSSDIPVVTNCSRSYTETSYRPEVEVKADAIFRIPAPLPETG